MDQRSGDGRFSGRTKIFAISGVQEFPEFVGHEDRLCFEQDHPELPLPEGQSRGTTSPKKKKDRFPRGRKIAFMINDLLSSDWRSRYRSRLRLFTFYHLS